MIDIVSKFLGPRQDGPAPAIPAGQRVYAIGDIHGRMDLFEALAQAIEDDDAAKPPAETTVILLGYLVDRGPDSAKVVAAARTWAEFRDVRFISGNHEEMFLQSFFKAGILRSFMKFGGFETMVSYGLDAKLLKTASTDEVQDMLIDAVPWEDREFLRKFKLTIQIGDYLFVHAGIRPKRAIDAQDPHDCRWIREPFLSYPGNFGTIVIHGHTVTDDAVVRHNRIGIDTGAFKSGRLTALCLEGRERLLMEASDTQGAITTTIRPADLQP